MQPRLPSILALRAFEAAARHRSFTRASIELNLTQSAVSHQIRKLEDLLGTQLFERTGNEIRLTQTGADYLTATQLAITELRIATDRASREGRDDDVLTVGSLSTFAIKCLVPHLASFIAQNPDLHLRLRILPTNTDARPGEYDVSLLYGLESDWPGFETTRISTEEIFPVCSPALVQGPDGLRRPQDLAHHTIVRTTSPLILRDDWPFWLHHAGVGDMVFAKEITCDLLYPSYQLAIEGIGVAMGRSAVVLEDLAAGRLVEPFSMRLHSPLGYHIVHSQQCGSMPKVRDFVSWAKSTLGAQFSRSAGRGAAS